VCSKNRVRLQRELELPRARTRQQERRKHLKNVEFNALLARYEGSMK